MSLHRRAANPALLASRASLRGVGKIVAEREFNPRRGLLANDCRNPLPVRRYLLRIRIAPHGVEKWGAGESDPST